MDHCCLSIWCAKPNPHTRHGTNCLAREWLGQGACQGKDIPSLSKVGMHLLLASFTWELAQEGLLEIVTALLEINYILK